MSQRKNNSLILSEIAGQVAEEVTYQSKLQSAVFDGVSEADVKSVVEGIVKRAQDGDARSIEHLFDYVMGAKTPVKITQNNFYNTDEDANFKPLPAPKSIAPGA